MNTSWALIIVALVLMYVVTVFCVIRLLYKMRRELNESFKKLQEVFDGVKNRLWQQKNKWLNNLCDQRWRKEVSAFLSSGEITENFTDHVEHCQSCQSSLEEVYQKDMKSLREVAKIIQEERSRK